MALRIPEKYRRGVKLIATIDEPVFAAFVNAVSGSRPAYHEPGRLPVDVVVDGLTASQINEILESAESFYGFRDLSGWTNAEMVREMAEFIADAEDFESLTDVQRAVLSSRLEAVLSIGGVLETCAKARALLVTHDKGYQGARIITDIRPVFESDPTKEPSAAVLVHTLRLEYHESGEHKSIFIALDSDDIKGLQDTICRAKEKESTLLKLIAKMGSSK
jgi:hypothetical protein